MENSNYSLVSFCVYGKVDNYIELLKLNTAFLIANGFGVVIFCDSVNIEYLSNEINGSLILDGSIHGINNKMLWRLNPVFLNLSDVLFVRDADSIISFREIELMNEFINSEFDFHIIRDHPLHYMPVMGGLFGLKKSAFGIFHNFSVFNKLVKCKNKYNFDQYFLSDIIYPIVKNRAMIHTSGYRYLFEKVNFIQFNSNYCGKYANDSIAKFDELKEHLSIVNRSSTFYFIAKIFRYKWFLFIRKNENS